MIKRGCITQAKLQDEMFEKTGIEEEELLYSIEKLDLKNDPQFLKLMKQEMEEMQKQASGRMSFYNRN